MYSGVCGRSPVFGLVLFDVTFAEPDEGAVLAAFDELKTHYLESTQAEMLS